MKRGGCRIESVKEKRPTESVFHDNNDREKCIRESSLRADQRKER